MLGCSALRKINSGALAFRNADSLSSLGYWRRTLSTPMFRNIVSCRSNWTARSSLGQIIAARIIRWAPVQKSRVLFDDAGDFDGRPERQSRVVVVDRAGAGECQYSRNNDHVSRI